MQLVNQAMVLRVHGLALKTTVAAMRVNALHCLGELVSALDKLAILDILLALQHCTAIDHSTPTLMCTLGVANSIYKQHGTEFAIEHVLSLLFPLRTAQQLNVQQFTYKIEEKRGATMSDSGASQVKVSSALANELRSEPLPKSSAQNSLTKSRPSCDEDWGPTVKKTTNASLPTEFSHQPEQSFPILQSVPDPAIPLQSLMAVPTHQTSMACTPVDIEWPPSNSYSGFGAQLSVNEKQNPAAIFNSAFDDLDPFANWPPKPSNLASVTVPTQSHDISGSGMSNIESSTGQSKPQ